MNRIAAARELVAIAKLLTADVMTLKLMPIGGPENVYDLPVVKRGSMPFLNSWARSRGYRFVKDYSLFGGYWTDPETGNAYLFDTP